MKKIELKVECLHCGKIFDTKPNKIKFGRGKYCSLICKQLASRGRIPWNSGKSCSKETIAKISESKRKNPTKYWLGKKRPDIYPIFMKAQKEKGIIPHFIHGLSKTVEYQKRKHREWLENNREYKYYLVLKRHSLKIGNGGEHSFNEWVSLKEKFDKRCLACTKQEPFINLNCKYLTQDHIIPLSKGGNDSIENIQPLCLHCNISKLDKTIDYRGRWAI